MTGGLKIIFRNFLFRKKRTFLTALGVIIGTTLILTLILLGDGLERALASQMDAFGGDLIFIMPGREDAPFADFLRGGGEIRDAEVRAIRDVPGVALVMPGQIGNFRVRYAGEEKVVNVSASPWAETIAVFEGSQGFEVADGEWPSRDDLNQVVLGTFVARTRFSRTVLPGEEMEIGGRRFLVSGVLKPIGNPDDDGRIYMSLDRFRVISGKAAGVNYAVAKAEPGADVRRVADDIRDELARRRGEAIVFTSENALRIVGDVLGIVRLVLGAFGAVALIVGGIGIMNTMFTSVLERTREIGVMKAVGATDRGILFLFLAEAGLLGAIGGMLGVGASYVLAKLIEAGAAARDLALLKIDFDPAVVLGALLFAFVVGAVFGAVPAVRASRLKPTEALRYE